MRFKTNIDSFDDVTEIGDTERLVRTNFNLTMMGYLLSERVMIKNQQLINL